ncbi:MAG: hypothetical protein PVJ67_04175 [Candidatus Pacearchaeota archaeon]|jgi:hypothetical protein
MKKIKKLFWLLNRKLSDKIFKFKVEKIYGLEKNGRYIFVVTTNRPINNRMYEFLKKAFERENKRLLKNMEIISEFIILDNGLDIKIISNKTS